MRKLLLILIPCLGLPATNFAAELSQSATIYESMLPDYFERADIVAYGYFEIPDVSGPDDGFGQTSQKWQIVFNSLKVFKSKDGVPEPVPVSVRNDILPYLDWNIPRDEVRVLREKGYTALVSKYAELSNTLIYENEQGAISDSEMNELLNLIEESAINTGATQIKVYPRNNNKGAPNRLLRPWDPYLVFLKEEKDSYELMDESYGFNLFFGIDAILFMRILNNL